MTLENMTTMWLTQLNNPECSMLAGMFLGNQFSTKWFAYLVGFSIIYRVLSYGMDLAIIQIKRKYREVKK